MSLHVSVVNPDDNELSLSGPPDSTDSWTIKNSLDDESDKIEGLIYDLEIKSLIEYWLIVFFLLFYKDLCANIKCKLGERCVVNENEAVCECIESCEVPKDERQKVNLTLSF